MNEINWYQQLSQYGDQIPMNLKTEGDIIVDQTEAEFEYPHYDDKLWCNRAALDLMSGDGKIDKVSKDLTIEVDRIPVESKRKPTDAWNSQPEIQRILDPWKQWLFRVHILRFGPGGFFTPHRDMPNTTPWPKFFRLIVPLKNCNPPIMSFIVDREIRHWEHGRLYFLDTLKEHYLFNSSMSEYNYWIICHVDVTKESIQTAVDHMEYEH